MSKLQFETIVGEYRILEELGAGGMATVYRAQSTTDDSFEVAFKIFHEFKERSEELRKRFRLEISSMIRVSHQNLLKVLDFYDDDSNGGLLGFTSELADNGDLYDKINNRSLTIEEVVDVLVQVTAGLNALHKAGIYHRDIKPQNILLWKNGDIKLADFGVSRITGDTGATFDGFLVGTSAYLAPEYLMTGKSSESCDLYSFGSMIFEVLTGSLPYTTESDEAPSLARYKLNRRIFLSDIRGDIPDGLIAIIERMLAPHAEQRIKSAEDLLFELESFKKTGGVSFETRIYMKMSKCIALWFFPIKATTILFCALFLVGFLGSLPIFFWLM